MNKKGFTLVELLGVIIILTMLTLIAFPLITGSVKNSSNKTDELTLNLIYDATDIYISYHQSDFEKTNGNKYYINLSDLVEEQFLSSPIKLSSSDTDITELKCVQIEYNNKYIYELKDNNECIKVTQ